MISERDRPHFQPAPEVTVRPMRGADIESVSRIERQSFPTPWSTHAYVTEIANPSACYLVATIGDSESSDDTHPETIVGYGGMWVIMDEAHITTLAVDPAFRGRRIGERLLCELLAASMRQGATRATLEVREGNEAAQRLYEKYGFVWVALRKGYYTDNNENAVIMWIDDMTTSAWRQRFAENRTALNQSSP